MPEIAVIIPCFNHANVLRRTLEALKKQTLKPTEVVVVDDGSTDDPSPIVADCQSNLTITFLRFEVNKGAPAARNAGAAMTKAPYLLFLDADAELVPRALQSMTEALSMHTEADFAYCDFYWGDKLFRGRPFDAAVLRERNFIHTTSLLRRSAFPGFDETLKRFQDWDLWLTMAARGSRGVWINQPLFRIEPRRDGISRWLPSIAYRLPWQRLGWEPETIRRHREAKEVIVNKHHL